MAWVWALYSALGNGALTSYPSVGLPGSARGEGIFLDDPVACGYAYIAPDIRIYRHRHPWRSDLGASRGIVDLGIPMGRHVEEVEAAADPSVVGYVGDFLFPGPFFLGPDVLLIGA